MNNVILITPPDYEPEAKDCPICKKAFDSVQSVINYRTHGCCTACDIKYRYPNRLKWEKGWRPNN